jgi:hypothetical protein
MPPNRDSACAWKASHFAERASILSGTNFDLGKKYPVAKEAAEEVDSAASAPKGASSIEVLAISLKRYPDTKPEFCSKL